MELNGMGGDGKGHCSIAACSTGHSVKGIICGIARWPTPSFHPQPTDPQPAPPAASTSTPTTSPCRWRNQSSTDCCNRPANEERRWFNPAAQQIAPLRYRLLLFWGLQAAGFKTSALSVHQVLLLLLLLLLPPLLLPPLLLLLLLLLLLTLLLPPRLALPCWLEALSCSLVRPAPAPAPAAPLPPPTPAPTPPPPTAATATTAAAADTHDVGTISLTSLQPHDTQHNQEGQQLQHTAQQFHLFNQQHNQEGQQLLATQNHELQLLQANHTAQQQNLRAAQQLQTAQLNQQLAFLQQILDRHEAEGVELGLLPPEMHPDWDPVDGLPAAAARPHPRGAGGAAGRACALSRPSCLKAARAVGGALPKAGATPTPPGPPAPAAGGAPSVFTVPTPAAAPSSAPAAGGAPGVFTVPAPAAAPSPAPAASSSPAPAATPPPPAALAAFGACLAGFLRLTS